MDASTAMAIYNEESSRQIRIGGWKECPECNGTPFGIKAVNRIKDFMIQRHF